jgi:hypothetical protein
VSYAQLASIITVVLALVALVVAIWQGVEHRRHNRLTVRPHLNFWIDFASSSDIWGITVTNNGPGTAFIDEFAILTKDRKILESDGGWITALWPPAPPLPRIDTAFLRPGDSIRPGEQVRLIAMAQHGVDRTMVKALHDKLWNISILIRIRSIYNERSEIRQSCGWLWVDQ